MERYLRSVPLHSALDEICYKTDDCAHHHHRMQTDKTALEETPDAKAVSCWLLAVGLVAELVEALAFDRLRHRALTWCLGVSVTWRLPSVIVRIADDEAREHEEEIHAEVTMVKSFYSSSAGEGETFKDVIPQHHKSRCATKTVEEEVMRFDVHFLFFE
mgnify:CR=1 FL=1